MLGDIFYLVAYLNLKSDNRFVCGFEIKVNKKFVVVKIETVC